MRLMLPDISCENCLLVLLSFLSERHWRHRALTYPAKHLCHIINLSQSFFCYTKDTSSSVFMSVSYPVFLLYAGRGCTETVLQVNFGMSMPIRQYWCIFHASSLFLYLSEINVKAVFTLSPPDISLCLRQRMGFCLGTKYTFCQNDSCFIVPWKLEI